MPKNHRISQKSINSKALLLFYRAKNDPLSAGVKIKERDQRQSVALCSGAILEEPIVLLSSMVLVSFSRKMTFVGWSQRRVNVEETWLFDNRCLYLLDG